MFKDRRAEKRVLFAFRYGTRKKPADALALLLRRPPWWNRWHGLMARRCGWCKRFLGLKWVGWGNGGETSHGICRACKAKYDAELDRLEESIGEQGAPGGEAGD